MVTEGTKEQLILAIQSLNRSASEAFLSQFSETDLREYLTSLRGTRRVVRSQPAPATDSRQQVAAVS